MCMNTVAKSPIKSPLLEEKYFSIEEYYSREEKSIHKHEYHAGKIIPMPGSLLKHNRLVHRSARFIDNFLDDNNLKYIVSNSDTKIRIDVYNKIVYPDAMV